VGGPTIRPALRAVLLLKAALLLGLAAVFAALAVEAVRGDHAGWARGLGLLCALPAPFLVWAAGTGLLDAALGRAVEVSGAVALRSRRSGYSLQLPDGHFAEFPLFNPGSRLEPGHRYRVTVGRYSRVIVEPPRPEG
jgi:hypothetical protein